MHPRNVSVPIYTESDGPSIYCSDKCLHLKRRFFRQNFCMLFQKKLKSTESFFDQGFTIRCYCCRRSEI